MYSMHARVYACNVCMYVCMYVCEIMSTTCGKRDQQLCPIENRQKRERQRLQKQSETVCAETRVNTSAPHQFVSASGDLVSYCERVKASNTYAQRI